MILRFSSFTQMVSIIRHIDKIVRVYSLDIAHLKAKCASSQVLFALYNDLHFSAVARTLALSLSRAGILATNFSTSTVPSAANTPDPSMTHLAKHYSKVVNKLSCISKNIIFVIPSCFQLVPSFLACSSCRLWSN